MKRKLGFLLVIFSILIPVASHADQTPPEQMNAGFAPPHGSAGIWFGDNAQFLNKVSYLRNEDKTCSSLSDPNCAKAESLNYVAILSPCATAQSTDCISSLFANGNDAGPKILGNLDRMIPETPQYAYTANTSAGLPQGASPSLWHIPGIFHKGMTDEYVVVASETGNLGKDGKGHFIPTSVPQLTVEIFPVILDSSERFFYAPISMQFFTGGGWSTTGGAGGTKCATQDLALCALRQSFPDGTSFGVAVKLSEKLSGWMSGRIQNPDLNYSQSSTGSEVTLSGVPTLVPTVLGNVDLSKLSKDDPLLTKRNPVNGSTEEPQVVGMHSIDYFNMWNRNLGNIATALVSEWRFVSTPVQELANAPGCILATRTKTLAGFVSTNSTTYSEGPPVFDKTTSSLNYFVASPHYQADKSPFKGTYDLYISKPVARCIYGFKDAPISATISVIDSTGQSEIAVTSLSETKDWLHLSADGFEFSSPKISVKLSQAGSPVSIIQNKITCIKGKTTKVISTATCPGGYKKK